MKKHLIRGEWFRQVKMFPDIVPTKKPGGLVFSDAEKRQALQKFMKGVDVKMLNKIPETTLLELKAINDWDPERVKYEWRLEQKRQANAKVEKVRVKVKSDPLLRAGNTKYWDRTPSNAEAILRESPKNELLDLGGQEKHGEKDRIAVGAEKWYDKASPQMRAEISEAMNRPGGFRDREEMEKVAKERWKIPAVTARVFGSWYFGMMSSGRIQVDQGAIVDCLGQSQHYIRGYRDVYLH
ncbi:unnamed protein product, partial [Mesorhabditis spiculigera]